MEREFRSILDILEIMLRLLSLFRLLFQQAVGCLLSVVCKLQPTFVGEGSNDNLHFRAVPVSFVWRACWGSSVPAGDGRRQVRKPPRAAACEVKDAWLWTEDAVLGHRVLVGFVLDFGCCRPSREVSACSTFCHRMDQRMLGQIVFNLIDFLVSSHIC